MAYVKSLGYLTLTAVPAVVFAATAIYYSVVEPGATPTGSIVLAVALAAGAFVFLPQVLSARKGALLRVDNGGIHLARGRKAEDDLSWDQIAVVRYGFRRVRFGKVSAVGYSILVEATSGNRSLEVDDVSFKVPRELIRRVAEKTANMAEERNIRVDSPATVEW